MNDSAPNSQVDVHELLAHMDLDQKLGQMMQPERMAVTLDDVRTHRFGSILSGGGSAPGANRAADWVAMADEFWMASMSPMGERRPIPLLYGVDAVHGHANVLGATVFPHNIGLGAANDPELIQRIGEATAREVLSTGVEWTFAPTLAVARDLRWGRTYESYSEDVHLVARYAGPAVRGLQGDLGRDGLVACAKHWVGDGGTTEGFDQGDTLLSEEELFSTHVAPYLSALESGVLTVMASFNSWNDMKCHGHHYLLTSVLKGRLGFEGFVVSDWDGVDYLDPDRGVAIGKAVNAGVDMLMVSVEWRSALDALKRLVSDGTIPMTRVDDAVRRILHVKQRYGLFERPRPADRYWSNNMALGAPAHRALAREAVRKSLVLLKQSPNALPVSKGARILVAGKNADNRGHQCGGFTVAWQGTSGNDHIHGGTSIWEGIREVAPQAELSVDGSRSAAGSHDVAIVVIGEHPYAEGMGDVRHAETVGAGSGPGGRNKRLAPYGDTLELSALHPEDLATIRRIRDAGIPVIAILVSGRPLVVNAELEHADAFIAAWLPGSQGQGVADALFGDHDFTGTLPFAWPASAEGGPASTRKALFPRGFGLRCER